MKIAQVCYLYPPAIGGVETHVEKISKYLKRNSHKVEVFCSDYGSLNRKKRLARGTQNIEGIKITRFRGSYLPGYGQKIAFPGLFSALMKADCDIIHVHSFPSMHFDICWLVSRIRGIPLVATGHYDPVLLDQAAKRLHKKVYWHAWLKRALRSCSIIAIINEEKRRYVGNFGIPAKNIRVIPNGVDLEDIKAMKQSDVKRFVDRYNLKGKRVVLFIGRICRAKGIDILITAMKPILKKNKNIVLQIVGPIDDNRYFEEIKKMADLPNITITGPLTKKEVLAAYKNCQIFASPTRGEVFGITFVEAMAFKKIVIGTRVGGLPDIIDNGRTGYLVESENASALRDRLEYCLDNYSRLGKIRENAYKKVLAKFSWKKIAKETENVYKRSRR